MGPTVAAERKATERINRQVVPWRYRAELIERTVNLLVQSSNDATRKLLMAHKVRSEHLPPFETMRDEAADCLHRHFVTVTKEEETRRKVFDAQVARATGREPAGTATPPAGTVEGQQRRVMPAVSADGRDGDEGSGQEMSARPPQHRVLGAHLRHR
jgi:hypothetical protein